MVVEDRRDGGGRMMGIAGHIDGVFSGSMPLVTRYPGHIPDRDVQDLYPHFTANCQITIRLYSARLRLATSEMCSH